MCFLFNLFLLNKSNYNFIWHTRKWLILSSPFSHVKFVSEIFVCSNISSRGLALENSAGENFLIHFQLGPSKRKCTSLSCFRSIYLIIFVQCNQDWLLTIEGWISLANGVMEKWFSDSQIFIICTVHSMLYFIYTFHHRDKAFKIAKYRKLLTYVFF